MRRNIKITIEYDGTEYVGWQRQKNGSSIQEQLEHALFKITNTAITVLGAGRTDSGVHARGQTANFFLGHSIGLTELHRAMNGLLPYDIVVRNVVEMDEKFSARHSAKEREYKYYISSVPTAFQRRFTWQAGYALDIALMNKTVGGIFGKHDFSSFSKVDEEIENRICHVLFAEWNRLNEMTVFTIRANRFLHGMVRALVGTLVDIGRGHMRAEKFETILHSLNRQNAGPSAPAKGLFLERVIYEEDL